MILIDTSTIITYIRTTQNQETQFYKLVSNNDCAVSIITVAELYSGKKIWTNPELKLELETILSGLATINLTTSTVIHAGELRAKYSIDLEDALIAATAIEHNYKLATENAKHFQNIPNVSLAT